MFSISKLDVISFFNLFLSSNYHLEPRVVFKAILETFPIKAHLFSVSSSFQLVLMGRLRLGYR